MTSKELSQYLNDLNNKSKFNTILNETFCYLVGSNSGRRGESKSFTIGIDSIIETLKDIIANITIFETNATYNEDNWRELAPKYFKDPTINSLSTVQTKLLFTTISKLINWANKDKAIEYSDNQIDFDKDSLEKAVHELELLAELYIPKQISSTKAKTTEIKTIITEKDLKQFAFKTFKVFLDNYGYDKISKNISEKDSTINDVEYIGIKVKPYFGSGNLIGVFENEQNKETLSSSNTPRFFDENLQIKEFPYSYFSTQWADVEGGTLSFNNLQKFVNEISNGDFLANKVAIITH